MSSYQLGRHSKTAVEEFGTLIPHERLENFIMRAGVRSGLTRERAVLLARLLTLNDLRGISSHGSYLISEYSRAMREGKLNPRPKISVVRESPVSLLVDGDGGLGYFPAFEGTQALARKAAESGIGVMVSRNHGHFGAAGIYARIPLEHDLLTFVTSGHQLDLREGMPLYGAAGGSPMAFSAPVDSGPPLVVDFGCMHDLYADDLHRDEIARLAPGIVLRSIGLGEICQTWGGLLTGLDLDLEPSQITGDADKWRSCGVAGEGPNQGALVICFRIDLFADPLVFKAKVRAYVERIRHLAPFPPLTTSYAAGSAETVREHKYRQAGIPIHPERLALLELLASELGIDSV